MKQPTTVSVQKNSYRIRSIDIVRGIVMVIMPLDHVRDLIHSLSLTQSPTDLATTTPVLFFARWITHLCAPVFVFLAGSSAYRSYIKSNDAPRTKRSLLERGLYLIALEFIVVNTVLYFDPGFHTLLFEVIAAIGLGFIILSTLLKWKVEYLALAALLIIFLHDALVMVPDSLIRTVLSPLFGVVQLPFPGGRSMIIAYPPIPWLGIMLAGFAAGKLFDLPESSQSRVFTRIGCGALLLFTVLRLVNLYGDPAPWIPQESHLYTVLSFLNLSKYPPSLLFCLCTLGIMFLLLATAKNFGERTKQVFTVYGRVPLFYFIVHFFVIHLLLIIILLFQGYGWSEIDFAGGTFGRPKGSPSGLSLEYVFLIWIGVVAVLYKPCVWFGNFKQRSTSSWITYL